MANFTFEKYNSMPEQVEENKKNIKELVSIIKPVYHANISLTTSDVTVAISDTNATADVVDGWLLDTNGLVFKITGGDGTNLLIEFYSDIKGIGQQGETGYSTRFLQTDGGGLSVTTSTSALIPNDEVKINDIVIFQNFVVGVVTSTDSTTTTITIDGSFSLNDKSTGSYITNTAPTLDGGVYTLDATNIINASTGEELKNDDIVIYCDPLDNNAVKGIYIIISITGTTLTMQLFGEISGGESYIHNIFMINESSSYALKRANVIIKSNDNTPMTWNDLKDWLIANNYTSASSIYPASGQGKDPNASNPGPIFGVYYSSGDTAIVFRYCAYNSFTEYDSKATENLSIMTDNVY